MGNYPTPLLGLAIGDALGMPFETRRPDDPFLKAWDGFTYLNSEYHKLNPGQWTDDTLMSTVLAESLIKHGRFVPEDVAGRYCQWYVEGPHRGMGKTTKLALQAIHFGVEWTHAGVKGAEGNGTAMRAAPLGLFSKDPWKILDAASLDASITHKSREAEAGSEAVSLGVGLLASGTTKPRLVDNLLAFLKPSKVKSQLMRIDRLWDDGLTAQEALVEFGTAAHVVQTVPSAFAAFLLTDSYLEAIQVAIRAGGDTDTTAAITGALAGAYYGRDGIPDELVAGLDQADYIEGLDSDLWESR